MEEKTNGKTLSEICKMKMKRTEVKLVDRFNDEICVGSVEDDIAEKLEEAKKMIKDPKAQNVTKPKVDFRGKNYKKWWKKEEVCEFYKGLMVCGVNFSLLEAYMNYSRTHSQLKNKYKFESKIRPELIEKVTNFRGEINDENFQKIMNSISSNVQDL